MNIQPVSIVSNRTNERIEQGYEKPPLFQVETGDTVNILIDGKDAVSFTNPFDFTVDLRTNLMRGRYLRVSKCIIPKINNITPFNNQLQIKHELGTTAVFNLQPAFYNTTTISNEITAKINAQFAIDGIVDTVTTSYDPITKTFSISSVGGKKFFIVDTCSFYTNGQYCCAFPALPLASTPTLTTIYGSMAGMIYTRYLTVHSERLNSESFAPTLTSDPTQGQNIIAILDVCSIYNDGDYDVAVQFAGNYSVIATPDAPQINIVNTQKNLHSLIDIWVQDEYGNDLQYVMNLGSPYPDNTLGITLWLKISF